jgi:hypothetical protein
MFVIRNEPLANPCINGKKLMFLKSEIDEWLKSGKRKTAAELKAEAAEFVAKKGRIVK